MENDIHVVSETDLEIVKRGSYEDGYKAGYAFGVAETTEKYTGAKIHTIGPKEEAFNAKMERSKAAHPSMGSGFPPAEQMDRLLVRVDKLEKQMSIVFVRLGIKKDDN